MLRMCQKKANEYSKKFRGYDLCALWYECFEDICLVHLTEEDTKRKPHHGLQLHPWGWGGGVGGREALISPIAIGLEGVTYGELQKFILSIRKLLHWEDGQMLEQASQRSHHSTSNVSAQEQFWQCSAISESLALEGTYGEPTPLLKQIP